ncbi:MAG: formate/nitrite transporter family protein [Nitrospiraceae bacterium]
MDYVKGPGLADGIVAGGTYKLGLTPGKLVIRGMLAGAYLAIATSMSVTVAVETGYWIAGALLFPIGLALAVLLGTEVITGSFALVPCAALAKRERGAIGRVLANFCWVFLGNLLGSMLYAAMFTISITMAGDVAVPAVGAKLIAIADAKTTYYQAHGSAGVITVVTKAILCNWMVSLAVVAAFASTSFTGKMAAIWGPTVLFFSQGFEHTVVNMFIIPVGILLGADIPVSTWWMWNQIPVTLGNLFGGMVFTGLALYLTHRGHTATPTEAHPTADTKAVTTHAHSAATALHPYAATL